MISMSKTGKKLKDKIVDMVNRIECPGIRSGEFHPFTELWMVEVDGRFFARSGRMEPGNSWYDAFRKWPGGYMELGNMIFRIKGRVPDALDTINRRINKAYMRKYRKYGSLAEGATTERLMSHTMEFLISE
jgi:hypothetical protein